MNWMFVSFLMTATIGPMGPDAPAREPQLAVNGSTVAMAFGAGHSIYFSRSLDSGKTFQPPVKVAESAIIPLTRHRGPRIAFAGSAIVITAVTGKSAAEGTHAHGLPADGDLMEWRSTDGGKTWSKGIPVNDVPGAAGEGLHGLASSENGHLFAAWLDKRDHGTRLYGSRSTDGGLTWSKNVLVYASPDETICECCHPSVALDADGTILVMWRNWLKGSRDMYLARSGDGVRFSQAQKLGEGTWKLNACPMDGGGIVASANGVVTAWRREHSIFLDRPGEREREIGGGTDVAVASGKAGVYAIWSTPASVELFSPGDKSPQSLGSKGSFPAIATLPAGGAITAWEDGGRISIHLLK
jgi:BNR repeat-like domain